MEREDRALREVGATRSESKRAASASARKMEQRPDTSTVAPQVLVLGYVSCRSCTRSDDPELEEQAARIHRLCAAREWQLVGVVADVETMNRRRVRRPSLTYAIDRLGREAATCLVVAELRRLCASIADLGPILDAVAESNARFISLDPAMDSATVSGRTALRVLQAVSAWERARRAEMISAAREKVVSSQTIQPKLKRRIQRMRHAGMTLQAIADTLNDDAVPTVRGGAVWRPSSVQAALGYKRPRL